ncbi:MAG: amine oxidase [Methylococcales bacterium]
MNEQKNADSLSQFAVYVSLQKTALKKHYAELLARELSMQQWSGCFQRTVLTVLKQAYADALLKLQVLPFDGSKSTVSSGLSMLTRQALANFDGFVDEFLAFVVDMHRTSCALSNFPDEHKPDAIYINDVKRDIAMLWQDFALAVNAHFLACR